MAATEFDRSFGLNTGQDLNRTTLKGPILVETLEYVEPRKPVAVPNHLLESRIYSKVAQNTIVQARPAVLHFGGYELHKTHRQTLRLANVSTEVQNMHIIPPQTKFFYIKYTKGERLVPGLTLDCVVEFTPNEWRYYYDCIRIHTKDEENLVIPIHAYPVMSTADFPSHIDFPAVPVGHSKTKTIPLRCEAPIDFEYRLTILHPHAAFTVDPLEGVVPANSEVKVAITYSPTEFNTANMELQLMVSQFNAKPLLCSVTGYSSPGLARSSRELMEKSQEMEPSPTETRCVTPIDRMRQRRKEKAKKSAGSRSSAPSKDIVRNGIRFPSNLDTPHAVSQVLNQEPGKLKAKDLREAMLAKKESGKGITRQMKEAVFEQAVRQDVYEERQNQLRWQVKLGADPVKQSERLEVLERRQQAWIDYKLKRGDPVEEKELDRSCTACQYRRTFRDASQLASEGTQFDMYTNDLWATRHSALSRFIQAARKIIVRIRADRKVLSLRQTLLAWARKSKDGKLPVPLPEEKKDDKSGLEDFQLAPHKVKSITFPTYKPPSQKDDMAVDALGVVPFKPTEVIVQTKVPYFQLKVPQQYKLMGYKRHSVHDASSGYVPPKLCRTLRTGAEDEVISLPLPEAPAAVKEPAMETEAAETQQQQEVLALTPPQALFQPMEYPSLHIFNPAPGLQVFHAPMPYAEVDPDFHLCPLPRYTSLDSNNPHMSTQRQYLDREEVIKGVMQWKKFPSQGLTSLSNTPTLTNVWVPRWTDPFGAEMLPEDVPSLFDGLPPEEAENIVESDGEETSGLELTPEMVNAQFAQVDRSTGIQDDRVNKEDLFPHGNKMPSTNIPVSSNGPVPREIREQELDFFLKKKYNKLGSRIQQRIDHMNGIKTNPDLVLK